MKKNNKGFVVSAVLYPLLVLFLALIMGLLSMSDTRKRILDKMKLEISDSIFDEATCSCDTILNKLNYLIKNGVSGGGGGGGSYTYNVLGLNVKAYEDPSKLPNIGNGIGDIAVITDVEITSYYVSSLEPLSPKHGMVWIVQDKTSKYFITSDYSRIGVSYAMQYICNDEQTKCEWQIKKAYVYDEGKWILLYYVPVKDGIIDLTSSDINAEIVKEYEYTGEYQEFTARFSGYYKIELWGAQGTSYNYAGGLGAYTAGEIYLDAGEILYVYVGNQPGNTTGGWNGGGRGTCGNCETYSYGYGGGGATDVRLFATTNSNEWNEFESLKSRIMVAAGGGSASSYNYNSTSYSRGQGGAGGALTGQNGRVVVQNNYSHGHLIGTGGQQATPGHRNDGLTTYVGGFGYGGDGYAGGGGGYYGGGGGVHGGSAGGGSSYISGHVGCNSIEEESLVDNIIHNGSAYHYSDYYFINTVMKQGEKSGNGAAKITLTTIEVKDKEDIEETSISTEKMWDYSFSGQTKIAGRYQVFEATKEGMYKVEAWGATGSGYNYIGGYGAYTSGEIYLTKGKRLYVYVGGYGYSYTSLGGWNGGGNGGGNYETYGYGYGGGGATDIRTRNTTALTIWNEFESLKSRIMVAAGGGSAGSYNYNSTSYSRGQGGAGGGLVGYNGSHITQNNYSHGHLIGTGGQQATPGHRNDGWTTYVGGFGYGANARSGGGGGYYGGGGSIYSGGGGGSSYISGYTGCNSVEEESTSTNIIHNGSPYHYSGYYFTNSVMKAGNDGTQPTISGDNTQTGNNGDGHVKITYQSNSKTNKDIDYTKTVWNYSFSGSNMVAGRYQIFDAPISGMYKVEAWGATGSGYNYIGGYGAYTSGEIYLTKGKRLYVYVGGYGYSYTSLGGWNGGGNGGGNYETYGYGYGGGGATDIRTRNTTALTIWNEFESLKSRIMVAAGGGSAGSYNYNSTSYSRGQGGAGGGLVGYNGSHITQNNYSHGHLIGTGGSQILGGYRNDSATTNVGGFGYGAAGRSGGGGGWYGGGGGHYTGGGGGSSYISGHEGCIGITSDGAPITSTYSELSNSINYDGYKFINTAMIDGKGYPWTTVKSSSQSNMPNTSGSSTQTGQNSSGYAKITYLGV